MSEANEVPVPTAAPAAPAAPAPVQAGPKVVAPSKPKNAIQVIEEEIQNFLRQKEQLVANSHAVEGAIQAAHLLLGKLKAEAAKAVAFTETEAKKIEKDIEGAAGSIESEAEQLLALAEKKL
jgi:hypothetical protein